MARIRTIKPGFWSDEDLSALPEATHMLAAALLNYADDDGYFNANPSLVKAACCPLREPSVSVHDSLNLLAKSGWLKLGAGSDGKRYGLIVTFSEHQRINRKTDSKIKLLAINWDNSLITQCILSEPSHPEGNKEGNKEGKGIGADAPALPSVLLEPLDIERPVFDPPAEPEFVESAEDQFWNLVGILEKRGIARSMCAKLLKLYDADFESARRCLKAASEAKDPGRYIGKALSNMRDEAKHAPVYDEASIPIEWPEPIKKIVRAGGIIEFVRPGRWRFGSSIVDSSGQQVGG